MPAFIINGTAIAKGITDRIKDEVEKRGIKPGLAVIRVGDDPASVIYVNNKAKKCAELGFFCEKHELSDDTEQKELLALIGSLNKRTDLHGILVQIPLPSTINAHAVQEAVLPTKDVDGLHPVNLGNLLAGSPTIISATPRGIMTLIDSVHKSIAGKHAVVVGRSTIVGRPTAQLLLMRDATVTMCHSKTKNLQEIAKQADILVVAVGKPKFITADYIKPGATVIDVGVNRRKDGICGDVDFESATEVAGAISPVPGGVGPMTIACLMQNTFDACLSSQK